MSFAVVWNDAPIAAIDRAVDSASPQFSREIVETIEALVERLGDTPMEIGESRQDRSTRVVAQERVVLYYRVIERLRVVRVFAAQIHPDRS